MKVEVRLLNCGSVEVKPFIAVSHKISDNNALFQ